MGLFLCVDLADEVLKEIRQGDKNFEATEGNEEAAAPSEDENLEAAGPSQWQPRRLRARAAAPVAERLVVLVS